MRDRYLITGGAGFIGSNYVNRLLERGEEVAVFDNMSRRGADTNIEWLREEHGTGSFELIRGDVRDAAAIENAARTADVIVHLASQVAVTTSVKDPRHDFETNAMGTFNVLEAARLSGRNPMILYASTNKVYGGLEAVKVAEAKTRYYFPDLPSGVPESYPLDFHSPYGCSKGAGDQYSIDYHRIYGMRSVVLRQSCIYGPRQFGIEDQGWVAWFLIACARGDLITIYGDGKQVRDILYIDDMLDAYDAAIHNIDAAAGQAFNIGGGPQNTLSVWAEFEPLLEKMTGEPTSVNRGPWRPGDQKVFIADIQKAANTLGWI
ncbi:MAG: SDR family NAD(P)-dependent oxidoreductase, partial [Anaerolineales bacterium]|nr:SDR family NAD(P)-dependent oxidoreductase [Anaerolineales bacterium]